MTKTELVKKIHDKAGLPRKILAENTLEAIIATISEALASGESVSLAGLGTFKVVSRKERKGRNPRTGAELTIPATKVAKFTPSKMLREALK